jgi:hypothetical protein
MFFLPFQLRDRKELDHEPFERILFFISQIISKRGNNNFELTQHRQKSFAFGESLITMRLNLQRKGNKQQYQLLIP